MPGFFGRLFLRLARSPVSRAIQHVGRAALLPRIFAASNPFAFVLHLLVRSLVRRIVERVLLSMAGEFLGRIGGQILPTAFAPFAPRGPVRGDASLRTGILAAYAEARRAGYATARALGVDAGGDGLLPSPSFAGPAPAPPPPPGILRPSAPRGPTETEAALEDGVRIIARVGGYESRYFRPATATDLWTLPSPAYEIRREGDDVGGLAFGAAATGAQNALAVAAGIPARWVIGRTRASGLLAFAGERPGDARTLDLAIVLSEGSIGGVEGWWLDGERAPLRVDARDDEEEAVSVPSGPYADAVSATIYKAADGSQGASLRTAQPTAWTEAHRLQGVSWAHVVLRQPLYASAPDRLFQATPNIEFLIDGIAIPTPDGETGLRDRRTSNAAAVRRWWLTSRRGHPADAIDHESFKAAYAVCETAIALTPPGSYGRDGYLTARYQAHGVISSGASPDVVEPELDFAWQGFAAESFGRITFHPGADAPPRAVRRDDVLEMSDAAATPSLQSRSNRMTMGLQQSSAHDWAQVELEPVADAARAARDGRDLPQDLGERAFVQDPTLAQWLMTVQLRRVADPLAATYLLSPGAEWANYALAVGDRIQIDDPENFDRPRDWVVMQIEDQPDFSLAVTCLAHRAGAYAEGGDVPDPPPAPRRLTVPAAYDRPPTPGAFMATPSLAIQPDGGAEYAVTVRRGDADDDRLYDWLITLRRRLAPHHESHARMFEAETEFPLPLPGTWDVTAANVSVAGVASEARTETVTLGAQLIPTPSAPILNRAYQGGPLIYFELAQTPDRSVRGLECRFKELTADEVPAVLGAADWPSLQRLGTSAVVPRTEETGFAAFAAIHSGRLQFAGRYVTELDTYGAIGALGVLPVVPNLAKTQVLIATQVWDDRGTHDGTATLPDTVHPGVRLLVPDRSTAAIAVRDWNHAGPAATPNWPWGLPESPAQWTSDALTFESSARIQLSELALEMSAARNLPGGRAATLRCHVDLQVRTGDSGAWTTQRQYTDGALVPAVDRIGIVGDRARLRIDLAPIRNAGVASFAATLGQGT